MNIDDSKARATRLFREELADYAPEEWSESDTRSKLIDAVLTEVLGWNEPTIKREPHVKPNGYIDYLLHTSRVAYVVEAKKNSIQFSLPSTKRQRAFRIGGVISEDKQLRDAIDQCRNYGISKGTSFCCVTNGTQFVFFRAHSDFGVEFEDHQAIIFDGPDDILSHFGLFFALLSFDSVCEGHHFNALPVVETVDVSARFKQLSAQSHKTRYRNRNRLEPLIRSVITEVFQDLSGEGADIELIEQCYVESPGHGLSYEHSLRDLVRSRPTLADGAAKPLRVARRNAGDFESAFEDSRADASKASEVIMLLGGIGAGKTTFISRFRKVIARDRIDKECLWLYVNFNKYSDAPGELERWVSNELMAEAEKSYTDLEYGSFAHLKQAYHSEYERLKRGRLAPLFAADPVAFEMEFSRELAGYERESIAHAIKLLRSAQLRYRRRAFLVFDNADQFDARLQNEVYMLAHRIASEVGCSLIVSMREESFWKNKDFGVLSAFHGVSFYVDAPDLKQVVSKRFRYSASLLEAADPRWGADFGMTKEEGLKVFASIRDTVLGDKRFIEFLEDLSPGEVRRPLDQLARFLFSGHTNIDSLLGAVRQGARLEIGFHEFIKSIALGDREIFNEDKSDIINLFSLDGSVDASNLNRLAVLGVVHSYRKDKSEHGLGYVSFEKVIDVCVSSGLTADTVQAVAQFLNARRLLETHQQARDVVIPSLFVRTTKAFDYYLNYLGNQFSYVDLVLPGTVVPQGAYFDMLERLSTQIYAGGGIGVTRLERIQLRIERARKFATFMREEAERHVLFKAADVIAPEVRRFVVNLDAALEKQSIGIIEAAKSAFASARERESRR